MQEVLDPHQHEAQQQADEVRRRMSQVAVMHAAKDRYEMMPEDASSWEWNAEPSGPPHYYFDRARTEHMGPNYAPERATEMGIPATVRSPEDAAEKSAALSAVHAAITHEADPTGEHEPVSWLRVGQSLLESAQTSQEPANKQAQLIGAMLASQFSDSAKDRASFLRTVYDRGMNADMQAACRETPIVILTNTEERRHQETGDVTDYMTTLQPISAYAKIFGMDQKHVELYARHLAKGAGKEESDGLPSAKSLHKELEAQAERAESDAHKRGEAIARALGGEKVGGSMLDVYKIERFALQSMFIKRQFQVLFGNEAGKPTTENVTDSAFARHLAVLRNQQRQIVDVTRPQNLFNVTSSTPDGPPPPMSAQDAVRLALATLSLDVAFAFSDLSQPLIPEFSLDGVDQSRPDLMTPAQIASWRYHQVVENLDQHRQLGQYLDYEAYLNEDKVGTGAVGPELWSAAEGGAAVPDVATRLVEQVVLTALKAHEKDDLTVTTDELYRATQGQRRDVLAAATQHIAEFNQSPGQVHAALSLKRGDDGQLELRSTAALPPKGSLDLYAAITLGCPALREIHESRSALDAEERIAFGSSNFIDHTVAAVINEARARGLFDIETILANYPFVEVATEEQS
ncbi:MAG TPA: hypothetical protein VLF91_06230 [Candidatus Saccharimonadales bacterium]|nr:hypothetical protein [Candidatus Saccharimonadales bacterium]